jgi:hypothetical protein
MNHAVQQSGRELDIDSVEGPASVSHLVHVLRAYQPVILISLLSVGIGYALIAILIFITSPAHRTTVQPFRLEFQGASEGRLPNGIRFSASEIVSTPVLLKVYQMDELSRFTTFGDFSRSVFVQESNLEYERLVADYQGRLADPKLSPLDRDRLEKEFEAKRESISKNDYAVSYNRRSSSGDIPESLVKKVLGDILNAWSEFVINEQHALDYRVAVLSPQILDESEVQNSDPIVAVEVLRSKIYQVIGNIEEINKLPAAELVKTSDRMSLAEVRIRLEDIVRFQLEPLVGVARASGLVPNPALTIHFLENQLAYEQRRLKSAAAEADAARDALAMYTNEPHAASDVTSAAASQRPRGGVAGGEGETVMPQITDTFLDRLIALSKQAVDAQYRQKLIDEYHKSLAATIPLQEAVTYQSEVLEQMKGPVAVAPRTDRDAVEKQIQSAREDVRRLIGKVNEIYRLLSRNLHPATQLFSATAPPVTRIERARTLSRLALYGVALLLMALPVIVLLCLLHNRVREEERAARMIHPAVAGETAALSP